MVSGLWGGVTPAEGYGAVRPGRVGGSRSTRGVDGALPGPLSGESADERAERMHREVEGKERGSFFGAALEANEAMEAEDIGEGVEEELQRAAQSTLGVDEVFDPLKVLQMQWATLVRRFGVDPEDEEAYRALRAHLAEEFKGVDASDDPKFRMLGDIVELEKALRQLGSDSPNLLEAH